MNAQDEQYYLAYERRYQKAFAAGVTFWGHTPNDEALACALKDWVLKNKLSGKRVIEFACGEGASGLILCKLGCIYHGVDIAPSAVQRTRALLKDYPDARVSCMDMTAQAPSDGYAAALDVMGFHMLVTDGDRKRYLANLRQALAPGAPVLFFRELFRRDAYEGAVETFDDWKRISGSDYDTPQERRATGSNIVVNIPLVPARARTEDGYRRELTDAGFTVEKFMEMDENEQCPYSASIYARA